MLWSGQESCMLQPHFLYKEVMISWLFETGQGFPIGPSKQEHSSHWSCL